ncbi:MAG: class I SAM-dependent methyltransferase [Bryobacteraceae bacterium]
MRDRFANGPEYFHSRKLDVLLGFLGKQGLRSESLRWLDLGCGTGELLRLGKAAFSEAWGCDVSEESLKQCNDLPVRVQDRMDRLPFDRESFDVVTAACVYHHVEPSQRERLTKTAYEVLRPGGVFCIFEHNPWNPVTKMIVNRSPVDVNAILLSATEAETLMRAAAFEMLTTQYFLFVPEFAKGIVVVESLLGSLPLGGQYAVFGKRGLPGS